MKIDTTTIDGFDEMSVEQQLQALKDYEFEDTTKLKTLLSKANSEASDYKKQLREKQSEEEKIKAEREESDKAMREKLAEYEKRDTISNFTTEYLGLGYDKDLAMKTALAMADGDMKTVFANQKTFLENQRKELEKQSLANQPTITEGEQTRQDNEVAKLRHYAGLD